MTVPALAPAPRGERRVRLAGSAAVALAAAVLFGWALSLGFRTFEPFGDYAVHNALAERIGSERRLLLPHPLYHVLAVGLSRVIPGGVAAAGFTVVLAAQIALGVMLHRFLGSAAPALPAVRGEGRAAGLALAVMLAGPLNVFTPGPGPSYYGYFPANALHSPTTVPVRPLALALFIAVAGSFRPSGRLPGLERSLGIALLTILCGLAKPNFVSCLLPALALAWLIHEPTRRTSAMALVAVGIPAGLLFAWQAWLTWGAERLAPSSVAVGWFDFLFRHMPASPLLAAWKLLMSVLFPLTVAAAYARRPATKGGLTLAWATFLVGVLQAYFLSETGSRRDHGNFLWGGQLAASVLFAVSARTLAAEWSWQASGRDRLRWSVCVLALVAHVVVGAAQLVAFARTGSPFNRPFG